MKKYLLFIFFFVTVVFIFGIYFWLQRQQSGEINRQAGKLQVVATTFPVYDFAKNIGGDMVEILVLLPAGVESHSFEPKPSDMTLISKADVFVYTGKFMEPWAEDVINGLDKSKIVIVDASLGVRLLKEENHDDEDDHAGSETDGHHDGVDPHIWLDFENARQMAANITAGLIEADPKNQSDFEANAFKLDEALSSLDGEYQASLASCRSRVIVYGGHYAFGYLADRYGLEHQALYGISADSEPSVKDSANLIEQVKKSSAKYIFFEEMVNPKITESLAKEAGAQVLPLVPAGNIPKEYYDQGKTFISIMEDNLVNLKTGLGCYN